VFRGVNFDGYAFFDGARFAGDTQFDRAAFAKVASFSHANFAGRTAFDGAEFSGDTRFEETSFRRGPGFGRVTFARDVRFDRATFFRGAGFGYVTFARTVSFHSAVFRRRVSFYGTRFEGTRHFGPLLAYREMVLDRAVFSQPVQIEISALGLSCHGTRFPGGVQLRVRWAQLALDEADFPAPSIITGTTGLSSRSLAVQEDAATKVWQRLYAQQISEQPQLLSLMGANLAGVGLSNVTVADCRFFGAHNLDKMRLEADVGFAAAPSLLRRFSRKGRQSIAEESDWRADRPDRWGWQRSSWPPWLGSRPDTLDASQIAIVYRALRKGREDARNEPGAADFYYGEMEMRRHAKATPGAERAILWLYWLVSGYGLRALRSVAALLIVGMIVTIVLTGAGLAATAPVTTLPQQLAGTISLNPDLDARISATLHGMTPRIPPADKRWTGERALTATEVTLESFVFRSTDQPLTTVGTWASIAARILGPILLALTLLAVRNRVKR
jgi:hypothetical protein